MTTNSPSSGIDQYFGVASHQLNAVLESQRDNMVEVARLWTEAVRSDKLTYTFGSGHSRFIAGELYWRAGGLAPVMMIEESTNGMAERIEGYAPVFMQEYNIQPGDLLIVISNSGINPVPIEVALSGKEAGATIVAVTGLAHSQQAKSRHSSGKKLYEIADVVLDTMGVYGDAAVPLPGYEWRVAPTSTVVSVTMLDAIVAQTAWNLAALGETPPVLISSNVPEGDTHNQKMSDKYWNRLAKFPRRRPAG